jgi:hybrid cluster-associated redox disulfide protein
MSTSSTSAFSDQCTIAEVLTQHPQLALVFFNHRMACVGCVFAPFETLQDAACAYDIPVDVFLDDLKNAIWRAPYQKEEL